MKIRNIFITVVSVFSLFVAPIKGHALFGLGDIVFDPALHAEALVQIAKLKKMIEEFRELNRYAEKLKDFAELDHEMLASQHFKKFFDSYKKQFDDIMNEIENYQGGGLMGKLDLLDSRYPSFHTDWEHQDKEGDEFYDNLSPDLAAKTRSMKKAILLTKIQMKHALKVGGQIRESLVKAEDDTRTLLDDNKQAAGLMVSLGVGNELTGMVAKQVTNLNFHMNEFVQAYSAAELEKNQHAGHAANRAREAFSNFGKMKKEEQAPLNPIGVYSKK